MDKIKFYGAAFWGGCAPVKQYLLDKGIDYDYYDISENEDVKEEFMSLREKYEEYSEIIDGGVRFGIPALFFKDKVSIGGDTNEIDKFLEYYFENI